MLRNTLRCPECGQQVATWNAYLSCAKQDRQQRSIAKGQRAFQDCLKRIKKKQLHSSDPIQKPPSVAAQEERDGTHRTND